MRRTLIIVVTAAAAALGGVWAASAVAPCAVPRALSDKIAPGKAAACPAAAQSVAEAPRAVEPPAVTIVPALRREFVDRLFVSGTLVAREEAQVSARIDALAIVELDAEDGDRVKEGQVLARLDRTQLDAMLAENDAATKRADAAIDQAGSLIAQSQAQVQFSNADFERAHKLEAGVMAASTVEQREMAMKTAQAQLAAARFALGLAEADRKSRDAERQELHGAHRSHRGESARGGNCQPPFGQARGLRLDLRRAAVSHHRGRSDRSRGRRARAGSWPASLSACPRN